MPPPRPASGDTIYVMYAYGQVTITVCPCWPASTTNQSGLVTLTFDLLTLKVVSESVVTWATSMPLLVFLGLCYRVTPDVRDRRQTKASLNVPAYQGRGHITSCRCCPTTAYYVGMFQHTAQPNFPPTHKLVQHMSGMATVLAWTAEYSDSNPGSAIGHRPSIQSRYVVGLIS